MNKVVNKTVDVLARFGERIERHFSTDPGDDSYLARSGSNSMFPSAKPSFYRPLDGNGHQDHIYASDIDGIYGNARNYSSDNLVASPGNNSFSNYRQNPMRNPYADGVNKPPYGTGIGAPLNYNYGSNYHNYSRSFSNSSTNRSYSSAPGSVGYAPDYYVAERRQVELVPAPPPRIVQQPVPYPVPVDRPVPQPYPVHVPRPYPVDRPVPVPVPSPVHINRPVPVPYPVPVPSPPPPPMCVPYPVSVPTAVPYYVPVGVPVQSPPSSPFTYEQSVTHHQRWTGGMNPYGF